MTGPTAERALLFLDVDGPLLPFGGDPGDYAVFAHPGAEAAGNPLLSRLDPGHGPRLAGLACELVWATTWMDDANACLAPLLGLPPLPVLQWPDGSAPVPDCSGSARVPDTAGAASGSAVHGKTPAIVDRAAGRPFVWIDDEISPADRAWVSACHPGPALLHRVDARRGLTGADYLTVEAWLRAASATGARRGR
ncbi:hypothetical protein [Streptomyces genisteinicus]|uniref:Secreted protein n=1 Tax=Streptomyces genisteinicus TaxID=2768068 RepID=A0A7H0I0N9_9ACTN|nr:hypothetical protein [Streptomyces genisteinicus]QNP66355.1 hypothetical protein IAG43_27775 [Streptomyces genisteinicus]